MPAAADASGQSGVTHGRTSDRSERWRGMLWKYRATSCPSRRPELRPSRIQRRREVAGAWWLGGPQRGAVGGSDGVRGHWKGAGGGAAGAQDLDVVAAGCRGRAVRMPARAGAEAAGEVGPVARNPAGKERVGLGDHRGVGGGQGVED